MEHRTTAHKGEPVQHRTTEEAESIYRAVLHRFRGVLVGSVLFIPQVVADAAGDEVLLYMADAPAWAGKYGARPIVGELAAVSGHGDHSRISASGR